MRYSVLALVSLIAGCSGETSVSPPAPCKSNSDCTNRTEGPQCIVATGTCKPRGYPIGTHDGSPASVTLTLVYQAKLDDQPTGLAFNPDAPNELWLVNRATDFATILYDPGLATTQSKRLHDPDALHFMHVPTGIAFGTKRYGMKGSWGTCGESDNPAGHHNSFMGPALFSSDLAIFAKPTASGLGSHLDMLHDSPFCMGIAYEQDNIYWVFDGKHGSLARYDFGEFHPPGGDDHSDGKIGQYVMGELARVPNIPSHLVFNPNDKMLYAADSGHQRIVRLDTTSGTLGPLLPTKEPVVPRRMDNATLTVLVAPGPLEAPSGIALNDGILYVTDNATSRITAFDLEGNLVRKLDTGLPAGSLAGLTFGADGKIYFVDMLASRVYRIDP